MAARPKHRDAIVAAAARLFRRKGFAGAGLAEILEMSGAPKGSLYHYFPAGKAAIGAAAIASSGEKVRATIAALPAGERPGDFFREYARLLAGWMRASGYRDGCPISTTVLEEAADDASIAQAGRAAFDDWRAAIRERLVVAGGPPARAEGLALLAMTSLEGALIVTRAERSDAAILAVGETVAALMDAA